MNEKHAEVEAWLEGLFGVGAVPVYEINATTMQILCQLKSRVERQDKIMSLVVEDHKQKTNEYRLEANRIGSILREIGLSPESLSQSGTVSLRTLVSSALLLNTNDVSETSLLIAISEGSQTALQLQEARKLEQRLYSQILAKTKSASSKYNALKKALDALNEQSQRVGPELEKKAQQAGFLQSKAREYQNNIQQLQRNLKSCGVDHSINHSTLLKKSEELSELREKLHPMIARLDSYRKLPPDLNLARVKVEEGRRELESLEKELSSKIDLMHL